MSHLKINTDGGARGNPGPAATGYIIQTSTGTIITRGGKYIGSTTNNVAEYTAVIHALEAVVTQENLPTQIDFFLDSLLVVQQLSGKYKIKQPHLQVLAQQIHQFINQHQLITSFTYIPRAQNSLADAQVNQILDQHQ